MLNVLLITLGLAYLTELAGLSLALGAFLAGMLISETEYRYQVEEDIKPFRDVLLGLFFITVGMFLDVRRDRHQLPWVPACWGCCWPASSCSSPACRGPSAPRRARPCAAACGCAPAASSASC
jgi:Kef-type K+ transport system membrane component KefB